MLASGKAQIARREICAVKSLRLLLLIRFGTVGIYALVVGAALVVGLVHVDIFALFPGRLG